MQQNLEFYCVDSPIFERYSLPVFHLSYETNFRAVYNLAVPANTNIILAFSRRERTVKHCPQPKL